MSVTRDERTAYLMLTGMALCFGGTWVAGAVAVDAAPPFTIAAIRFGVASLLLYAWARLTNRPLSRIQRADWGIIAGLGLTAIAGYNWLFLTGLTLAPASDGAIIVPGLAPVFTAVIAGAVLHERLGVRGFIGLAVAAFGLFLVVNPTGGTTDHRLLGDLLFIAGAALWGVYSVIARVASRRFNAVSATLYGTAFGTVVLIPAAILEGGEASIATAPAGALLSIAYLTVFGTVLAFVFLNMGVARIGAARASAFALLVPIIGVLTSVALLDEKLGPLTLVGGIVVLIGLWLIEHRGQEPAKQPAHREAAARTG
ncbi:MAG TPA: DMT family transporter [Candidatus Limnocylindria bacterium]|nr:DMT family transporter [Candidatus Limnocylindria bacterium]